MFAFVRTQAGSIATNSRPIFSFGFGLLSFYGLTAWALINPLAAADRLAEFLNLATAQRLNVLLRDEKRLGPDSKRS